MPQEQVRTVHVNVFAIARAPVTNCHPAEGLSWADAVANRRGMNGR